ncbi:hypothetical protein KSD_24370 [Ktedonobacter sp. SOSP1-85]|uniref:outer membrane protein assembly factor BamB family protein n=1 Tax=Ktedonobacter sp. SOSP1-85 TaxID=2778367 RepID=UPI0019163794|nr:PQQ-binding-like beta-propeller repeat protein [Ktedonobacter sp. SOSP1-85]GHO74666.1 hypothetical protein KSD_24370 [Ktedonobacter sp. SOSP1-85]
MFYHAVLVVVVLAGGAFLLFSDRSQNGPDSSVVGGQVPSNANVLFTSPEIPGQVKKANIYAVNAQNGSVYWKATLKTKLTTSELVPHEGTLFAPGYDGNLYALSAKTGQVLWKYSVKNDPAPGQTPGTDNVPSSPIADGDTVYFGAGSGFYAVNIRDGKLLWHVKTPTSCKPPVVSQQGNSTAVEAGPTCPNVLDVVANGRVYGFFDGLYAFDASDGK